ncbi:restriction endonuclease [Pseudomonas sp. LB1P83]
MENRIEAGIIFEQLVEKILKYNNFTIFKTQPSHADLLIRKNSTTWVVEIKHYKTQRAQLKLLSNAAKQIRIAMEKRPIARGMLVASCIITQEQRAYLRQRYGITIIDRQELFHLASDSPELIEELYANLEIHPNDLASTIEDFYSSPTEIETEVQLTPQPIPELIKPSPADTTGTKLSAELRGVPPGKAHWNTYEKTCEKILKYLFEDHLAGWSAQYRTDDELNRFDYVCRIKPSTEFWDFVLQHLQSRYIIFEFKNYEDPIRQGQVLTTEKYLLEKGLRRVAIMFTRKGAHASAVKMTQGAMRESGKLIMILDDKQICRMLQMKENGSDPTDLLFDITDKFLLSLPR